mmetsp:Transcript_34262/g.70148  ORF Transcript_34262/g.70148 Transcript_34262/m.70148 type:complete len:1741 (-) Transcript_34262:116-5338(-)
MVVLTALLVKAAYDRYNSDNNLSEDSNNNNNSNTLQQQPNNPRNTSRKFRSRRNNKSSTTNSSIDNNRSNSSILPGSPIKFTREHSFHLLHSMSTPSTDCNNDSTTMMAGGNTNNNNSGSSGEGKERYIHHGKYRIDTKREVLTLPPPSSIGGGGKRSEEGEELTEAMLDNDARDGHATRVLESASSSHSGGGGVDGVQQNGGNNTKSGEQTTFRTDVRNEWIDAIFGKDFYPLSNNSSGGHDNGGGNAESSINIQQGVGAANIPHYVTYGAIVDPMPAINASNSTSTAAGSTAAPSVSTPRKVVQSKTQSTPIMLQEDGDDPSIVTYRDGGGGTVVSSGVGGNAATTTTAAASTSMTNGGYQTPLRNGGGYPQQTSQRSTSSFQGLTTIPSTPSSTSTNTSSSTTNNKLGITISRIPLGLYIKSISLHSEGYTAGISPGSILVNINGMGMLGERSDRALERLWMYAGLLSGESSGGNELREDGNGTEGGVGNTPPNSTTTSSSSASTPPEDNLQVKRPIQLTLYKSGRLYTVLLLSGHPLSGIEWAPCGNFALVQRVVSNLAGYNAGVRRGTIVCAVNGETLRTLDHVGVARVLRSKFLGGERMVIGLGYTPAASRSTFMEREDGGGGGEGGGGTPNNGMGSGGGVSSRSRSPIPTLEGTGQPPRRGHSSSSSSGSQKKKSLKKKKNYEHYPSVRDVEVRSRPMEYSSAISETFFACAGPSAMGTVMEDRNDSSVGGVASVPSVGRLNLHGDTANSNLASGIADVAAYVAAGGILPPGGVSVAAANIAAIRNRAMLANQVAGVSGSRRSYQPPPSNFGPCPTLEREKLLETWNPLASLAQSMSYHAAGCCETRYVEMGGPFESGGADTKDAAYSVTECLGVIQEIATSSSAAEAVFDAHLLQLLGVAISPTMANKEVLQSSEAMFDVLVDVAMTNVSLCQRLFFLLRSFIGVLETQKAEQHGSETTVIALKLLRYAQRSLSGRMFDKSVCLEEGRQGSIGYPMNHESSSSNGIKQQYARDQYAHLTIPASESMNSPASLESPDGVDSLPIPFGGQQASLGSTLNENPQQDTTQVSKKKGKGKKILKLFKKRSFKIPPTSDQSMPTKTSPDRIPAKSFTFSNVFNKNTSQTKESNDEMSMSRQFENMAWILRQIDNTCSAIEKNLMKSFSQKVADWALWSSSKESALASVTQSFRSDLRLMNNSGQSSSSAEKRFPILNPLDPTELLTSVDANECFILPSAHFPLLLCFDSQPNTLLPTSLQNERSRNEGCSQDVLYRTKVEILGLSGTPVGTAFSVQGSVAGVIQESTSSNNTLIFETKSNWGYPKTLSLKVASLSGHPELTTISDDKNQNDVGCSFVDLSPVWKQTHGKSEGSCIDAKAKIYTFDSFEEFDQHGEVDHETRRSVELQLRVSTEIVAAENHPQKCLLLYKHGDDLRQELLAIQLIERCNEILKASGLDLKLKTFRCLPVGAQKGFIEWVKGTVPLSELCKTSGSSHSGGSNPSNSSFDDKQVQPVATQADKPQPQRRSWCKYQSIRGLRQQSNGSFIDNPIQDFLRSAAFDDSAPYFVKKDVMDTYVKSCAGYCVITYLLGVGDRHLDNILLHQNGHLLHCDYSFILGHDPKTYMPMRITEEMVMGFGGRESDNFARFVSFAGAAFLTLRRHNNLRSLLSHVRLMVDSNMVDVSIHQSPEEAILAMRGRFRLDLNDDDALTYIEDVVEKSIASKMWKAVDVIHSIGMHF